VKKPPAAAAAATAAAAYITLPTLLLYTHIYIAQLNSISSTKDSSLKQLP